MKREKVEAWIREVAPGESLVAFLVGGPVNGGVGDGTDSIGSDHAADLHIQAQRLGWDPARRISPVANLAAVLTERQLLLASIGGMWGARPKDLLHAAPRGQFRAWWWINDASAAPAATFANLLVAFADGSWAGLGAATKLMGKTVAAAAEAERFLEALGPDGSMHDWRGTASP